MEALEKESSPALAEGEFTENESFGKMFNQAARV
jgi:hypothetical protein